MRRILLATTTAAALLGCGGGSKDQGPVDGGPPAQLPTGTGGAAFAMSDAGAVGIPPTTCNVGGFNVSASGLLIGFTSFGGVCDFARAHGLCDEKASASQVAVVIVKAGLFQAQSPVGPGTYTFVASPSPDASGNLVQLSAEISHTDAACASTPVEVTAGSVTITSATGSRVVGTANLTFADGSTLSGAFDVGTCAYSLDLCGLVNGTSCTGTPACVP